MSTSEDRFYANSLLLIPQDYVEGFDPMLNCVALAEIIDDPCFTAICQALGVRPLSDFLTFDSDENINGSLAETRPIPEVENLSQYWFDSNEGLLTVRTLLLHFEKNFSDFIDSEKLRGELGQFEVNLDILVNDGLGFRIGVDWPFEETGPSSEN